MSQGRFAAKIIRERAIVLDLRVLREGRQAWFILEIEKAKYTALKQAMAASVPLDLTGYGTILYSGYGEVSDALKAELREKYGMY